MKQRLTRDARALGIDISERQSASLLTYLELLGDRAVPLGLVSKRDALRLYDRHLLDCLVAVRAFGPADRLAYDLGSGAGLPGIVLAVALPRCRFELVEARSRRIGFLEYAVEVLGLDNAFVVPGRAEDLEDGADVVTARAFAPAPRAWTVSWRLLRPGGRLVYFAGEAAFEPKSAFRGLSVDRPVQISVIRGVESRRKLVIMSRP